VSYLVTAPLVIAKDQAGQLHHMYAGSVIPWLSDVQRDHFLDLHLVEELGSSDPSDDDEMDEEVGDQPPPKSGTLAAWKKWALSKGASPDDVETLTKADLIELYG
jgi:hypothetical protein